MPSLKFFHVLFVTLSISGFAARGLALQWRPELLQRRWVRTVPHVNDTLLLSSGIAMLVSYGWNPLHQPWLTAKLAALFAYILLGSAAIGRRGHHGRLARTSAWLAAMAVFGYIVLVALYRTPQPWLAL